MRQLLFKALTSPENKKRDFRVFETFTKNGVLARSERRCFYFVLGRTQADLAANLPHRKRHYHILKTHDNQRGEDRLICKVAGSFYAVCGNDVYCIAFLHSFKVTFTVMALDKTDTPLEG